MNPDSSTLIPMETLERVAPVIRLAAHPLRLRILDFLHQRGRPCSVSEIIEAMNTTEQAVVSQQLRVLRNQNLLVTRRQGTFVFYSISNPSILHLLECIRQHG